MFGMSEFALTPEEISALKAASTDGIQKAFFDSTKRPVHKWTHYFEVYETHLAKHRHLPILFLEIGVMDGGSLDMWRRYFGSEATIVGIDINPECASRVDPPNFVRIGSQADPIFLRDVIVEFGAPDVILDDGSHIGKHQRSSFDVLFPILKHGGLYIIEDTQTSYWPDWEGGYKRKGTAVEYIKQMIDDIHGWYHNRQTVTPAKRDIGAIHIYDSLPSLRSAPKQDPASWHRLPTVRCLPRRWRR